MSAAEANARVTRVILLVEDELLTREMLVEALDEAGFSTLAANDARAAGLLFEQHGDEIRALVTDINLDHGTNGWQLARAAREQARDLPVVYISGASGHEWASRGVPNSLMISKPFAPAQLVGAITALLVAAAAVP